MKPDIANDTTAAIAATISTSSAVIHFTQTWGPVLSFCVGLLSVFTGTLAGVYYLKKIRQHDGGEG
jgi:hypothetical protein